jgi:hypothetical protein
VTVEITPRVRANSHPDWLYKNVKDLESEFVRVTGWLMLDTKHIRERASSQRTDQQRINAGHELGSAPSHQTGGLPTIRLVV